MTHNFVITQTNKPPPKACLVAYHLDSSTSWTCDDDPGMLKTCFVCVAHLTMHLKTCPLILHNYSTHIHQPTWIPIYLNLQVLKRVYFNSTKKLCIYHSAIRMSLLHLINETTEIINILLYVLGHMQNPYLTSISYLQTNLLINMKLKMNILVKIS